MAPSALWARYLLRSSHRDRWQSQRSKCYVFCPPQAVGWQDNFYLIKDHS